MKVASPTRTMELCDLCMLCILQSGEAVVIFATFQKINRMATVRQRREWTPRVDKLLIGDENRLNEALSFDDRIPFGKTPLHNRIYFGIASGCETVQSSR